MASAALQTAPVSAEIRALMTAPETRTDRIARLQREARALALDDVEALVRQMAEVVRAADDIAQGGDAYPVGVRDAAQRLAVDLQARADTLRAISGRVLI
ncbi:hypothetical protein [Brevundimonas sp.]|uniref:hypothetical protein n=1 Tax=Brevundimonas sp. TaxID=1871086 RepID=UPI0035B3856F